MANKAMLPFGYFRKVFLNRHLVPKFLYLISQESISLYYRKHVLE